MPEAFGVNDDLIVSQIAENIENLNELLKQAAKAGLITNIDVVYGDLVAFDTRPDQVIYRITRELAHG